MIFLGGGFGFTKDTFYPKQAGRFAEIGLTEGLAPQAASGRHHHGCQYVKPWRN